MTVIQINDQNLITRLNKVARAMRDPTPLTAAIAQSLATVTDDNFQAGGRPTWAGLASGQPSRLFKSNNLRSSILPINGKDFAMVTTSVPYAAIHQFGGKTKPHVILPKTTKALAFGGKVVKKVNHPGSNIPARPFLPMDKNGNLQAEAEQAIWDDVDHFYKTIFD